MRRLVSAVVTEEVNVTYCFHTMYIPLWWALERWANLIGFDDYAWPRCARAQNQLPQDAGEACGLFRGTLDDVKLQWVSWQVEVPCTSKILYQAFDVINWHGWGCPQSCVSHEGDLTQHIRAICIIFLYARSLKWFTFSMKSVKFLANVVALLTL